jgi:hypothetical protein
MPTDQTATVTVIRPPIDHYPPCQRETYGRAVMALMDGPADQITAANLRAWVRGYRETTSCDCLNMRIRNTKGQLERAQKQWEACMTEDNADRVAFLRGELARLRGMA